MEYYSRTKQHIVRISVFTAIISLFMTLVPFNAQVSAVNFEPIVGDKTGLVTKRIDQDLALGTESATAVAFNLINTALTLLGTLCVLLLIWGGFTWLWARGNQEEITKAKEILQGTIIGLIIVLASLGIARYVFTTVGDIVGSEVQTQDSEE